MMCKTCVELVYVCGAHRIELVNVSIFLNTTHRLGTAHDERRDEGRYPRTAFVCDFISTEKCAFKALRNLQSVNDYMRQEWTQTRGIQRPREGLGRTIEEKTDREYVCTAPICKP